MQLINDENWWHGPSFLQNPEELWPVLPIKEPENSPDYCEELKSNIPKRTATLVSVGIKPEFDLEQLIDPSRYSKIGTILRVTAYIWRFVRNLQSCRRKSNPIKGPITTEEISLAEKMWIRQIQVSLPKMKDYKKVKESLSLFEDSDKNNTLSWSYRSITLTIRYQVSYPLTQRPSHHATDHHAVP